MLQFERKVYKDSQFNKFLNFLLLNISLGIKFRSVFKKCTNPSRVVMTADHVDLN